MYYLQLKRGRGERRTSTTFPTHVEEIEMDDMTEDEVEHGEKSLSDVFKWAKNKFAKNTNNLEKSKLENKELFLVLLEKQQQSFKQSLNEIQESLNEIKKTTNDLSEKFYKFKNRSVY